MAENIEIKVQDQVSSSISTKLQAIASDARAGYDAVTKLQSALNALKPGALSNIQASANNATKAIQQNAIASQRLATAQAQTATASQRLATAQNQTATSAQRLATEQARTATASANAANANDRAALSALRLSQAQAKAAQESSGAASAVSSYVKGLVSIAAAGGAVKQIIDMGDAYTTLQNKLQNVTTSQAQVNLLTKELFELANRTRSGVDETATAFVRFDRALMQMGKSQEESLRLTETINKALIVSGATTAEASSALLQLSQGFNAGKLQGDEFRAVAENMPIVLDAVAKATNTPINQIKELASEGKITSEVLYKAFKLIEDQVDSTFGKTVPTVAQGWTVLKNSVTEYIGESNKAAGFTQGLAEIIMIVANAFQSMTGDISTANGEISAMSMFLKGLLEVFKVIVVVGANVGYVINQIGTEIGGMAAQIAALLRLDFKGFANIGEAMKEDAAKARKEIDAFSERVMKAGNTPAQSSNTAGAQLRGTGVNRLAGAVDKNAQKLAERREVTLQKINAQLDNQLNRMNMLAPAREAQAKFDQIEESLITKKIKLNDDERASIMAKIQAVQQAEVVQRKFDELYNEFSGPSRDYNATLQAANQLLQQGAISQEQYSRSITKANEAYQNSLDPLRQYNRDLQQQTELLTMLPRQREIEQQIMQVQNDLLSKGIVLNSQEIAQLREKLTLMQRLNDVSQQEATLLQNSVEKRRQYIDQLTAIKNLQANQSSGFTSGDAATATNSLLQSMGVDTTNFKTNLDSQLAMYATYQEQLKAMREAQLISEQEFASASLQIEVNRQKAQSQSAQQFFGNLAQLQSSSNKKLATIGKAAAIAQAMINTYQSATAAYAAMASIPYVGPALGAAAAAAAVAAGLANVAQIRSQDTSGYMTGGYTGSGPQGQIAGVVHGQEFVMNAGATNRIGVDNLQALQSGAASVQRPSDSPAPAGGQAAGNNNNVRIVNVIDPAMVGDFLSSSEGETVFTNIIQRNSEVIKQIANG